MSFKEVEEKLYQMEIGQIFVESKSSYEVLRVPGGWIYTITHKVYGGKNRMSSVFVPFISKPDNDSHIVGDKYLKQKCRQAYQRSNTQGDPSTPKINYNLFKEQLEKRGFKVIPKPIEGNEFYVDIFKPETRK